MPSTASKHSKRIREARTQEEKNIAIGQAIAEARVAQDVPLLFRQVWSVGSKVLMFEDGSPLILRHSDLGELVPWVPAAQADKSRARNFVGGQFKKTTREQKDAYQATIYLQRKVVKRFGDLRAALQEHPSAETLAAVIQMNNVIDNALEDPSY